MTQVGQITPDLIRRLNPLVSSNTLILHSVEPKKGDDLDVVLIGPKGLWYFEVKYINGNIGWHNGNWNIWQYSHETRQYEQTKMNEYPDAQWARMRDEVLRNLKFHGQALLTSAPILARIKGGIVFAHYKAKFDIQKPAPFNWGTIRKWLDSYKAAPTLKEMTPEVVLQTTEILLKRHQELNPNVKTYSMNAHVAKELKKSEERIQEWINAS